MKKGIIYLPVEVKVRELDAKLLLAYYAAKNGFLVVIGDHEMVEIATGKFKQGIFFSKGYPHGFRKRVITSAINNGHTVVELDEEGLIMNRKRYLRDRMKKDMLQLVTHEYCWGGNQKDIIIDAYPEYREKCHVVGNPRFDLLKPKFRDIYNDDAENIKQLHGDFVLINTRFSQYNSANGKKENVHFRHIKKLFYYFIEMIKNICEKFPDLNFIVRPHPGEDFSSYRKALSQYKNVHVIHEGNIIKWILASRVIIHNGCTSGIEAFLLGKPVISYVPITTNKIESNLPNTLGVKATSITSVQNYLSHLLDQPNINENNFDENEVEDTERELFSYIQWSKDNYSYESIIDLCNTIKLQNITHEDIPTGNIGNSEIKVSKKKYKRNFHLTETEIHSLYNKLDKIEGVHNSMEINRIGNNLYQVQSSSGS
ncbi:surface carbohydrate biosynthesis protein [Aquibacillus koreensis]|nr:surface carbohydrate biosynthesis protein [Aquibacillus koreensis]